MQLLLTGQDGAKGSAGVEVSDAAFGASFNEALVHQVVVAYLAGARSGSRAQKSRAEVRGGGAKPWRQKGTGRARAGSIRSPIWRGGGVTFAARPTQHNQKVNRKMYRAAIRSVLSELVRQDRLVVVEKFQLEAPKTSELAAKLRSMELGHVLIIVDDHDENVLLSARNLPGVDVLEVAQADPVSLVAAEKVMITVAGLRALEERLA